MSRQKIVLSILVLFLAGCSPHNKIVQTLPEERDPLETLNRATFAVNKVADRVIAYPIAKTYEATLPPVLRDRVRDVMQNLREPSNFMNALLQARLADAGKIATRFVLNSVLGVFGLIDVANYKFNVPYERLDFDSTLGSWGVKQGPYLVLPVKGPSTFRGTVGFVVDTLTDPLNIVSYAKDKEGWAYIRSGVEMVDDRQRLIEPLEEIEDTSVDFYTGVKSAYYQYKGGSSGDDYDALDLDGDDALAPLEGGEAIDSDYQ